MNIKKELNKDKYNLTTHEVNMIAELFEKAISNAEGEAYKKGYTDGVMSKNLDEHKYGVSDRADTSEFDLKKNTKERRKHE